MSAMVFDVPETGEAQTTRPASMENMAGETVPEGLRSQEIIGKSVISVSNGQKIGTVEDLLIDPATMRVAVLLLSKGGLINRDVVAVPVDEVEAWGKNAIMITGPDAVTQREKMTDHGKWVSANDQVRGRPVVTVNGARIGLVEDAVIDQDGYVTMYELSEETTGFSTKEKKRRRIPADTTQAAGQDVIIVDPGRSTR